LLFLFSGFLAWLSELIVVDLKPTTNEEADKDYLKVITNPLTKLVIQVTFSLVVLDFHTRFIYVLFDVVFTFSFICSSNNPYCCETYFF